MQKQEELYYHITTLPEYLILKDEERQVISDGLKRNVCHMSAFITNMPSDVPELCCDYGLL